MRIRLKVEHLRPAVEAAKAAVEARDGDVFVLTAHEMEPEEVEEWTRRVVGGARILICGGEGRLLTGLQLRRGGPLVAGPADAVHPGLPELGHVDLPAVGGPGFALYRVGEACVALGAPRGEGAVAYVGTEHPPAGLVEACLRWLAPPA